MPAYAIDGLLFENAIDPTARSTWSSETGMKLSPASVERHIPPVELPMMTTFAFTGETAIELTRPLVIPHAPSQADSVGDGPIGRHVDDAWGTNESISNFEVCCHAFSRASDGIEFEG